MVLGQNNLKGSQLVEYITSQYSPDWEVIGTLLDLPIEELKAIEAGYPKNVKWCRDQRLIKWLEVDPTASWKKMFTAIGSPRVIESRRLSTSLDEGMYIACMQLNNFHLICCMNKIVITVQTSYNLNGTHTRHATKTRVKRVYTQNSNFACAYVLSLNFSIIVSRHFKVINRTL